MIINVHTQEETNELNGMGDELYCPFKTETICYGVNCVAFSYLEPKAGDPYGYCLLIPNHLTNMNKRNMLS